MNNIHFIGIRGLAGSGKTALADRLAGPTITMSNVYPETLWEQRSLAAPLYEMVSIKRQVQGHDFKSRQQYQIHRVLAETFGNYVNYEDLVNLTKEIQLMDAGTEYDPKPRDFLIKVGDMMRSLYTQCFSKRIISDCNRTFAIHEVEYDMVGLEPPILNVVIPDIRYLDEIETFEQHSQLYLIKLEVDEDVRHERLINRDGHIIAPEHASHPTETQLESLTEDQYDLIVNTTNMTADEVAENVKLAISQDLAVGV